MIVIQEEFQQYWTLFHQIRHIRHLETWQIQRKRFVINGILAYGQDVIVTKELVNSIHIYDLAKIV